MIDYEMYETLGNFEIYSKLVCLLKINIRRDVNKRLRFIISQIDTGPFKRLKTTFIFTFPTIDQTRLSRTLPAKFFVEKIIHRRI